VIISNIEVKGIIFPKVDDSTHRVLMSIPITVLLIFFLVLKKFVNYLILFKCQCYLTFGMRARYF